MTHLFVCRDKGHSHEPHNELASVVLSSSGIGVREFEYRHCVARSRRLSIVVEQHSKIPIVPESRSTIDFILMPGKNWRSSIILLRATSGSLFELHVGPR